VPIMGINSASLQSNQSNSNVRSQLATSVSLRCVECAVLYPGASDRPRYRCDCGGVLDVEAAFHHPTSHEPALQEGFEALMASESDFKPLAGAHWRQLFDERTSQPPTWPVKVDTRLPDSSGVWRYRELILPIPEQYIVSRPEGNTGLYPVGRENCGDHRAGHRQIGHFAGLDRFFLKHEGENPTGSLRIAV